jgi:hypothetical protein
MIMKKIAMTVGLAAVGAASVHAAYAPDNSGNKTWSVSATLRGFYDDNFAALNPASNPKGSFGAELTPQFQITKSLNQTELGLRYIYALYYYEGRDHYNENPYDQNHWVNLWLDHVFNERWETKLTDNITVTQNPQLFGAGSSATSDPFRADGNYILNSASASVHTDWSRRFGTVLTYANNLYLYNQVGNQTEANIEAGGSPSEAGQFNRIDQTATVDFQWHKSTETILGLGYSFEWSDFTANEPISYYNPIGGTPKVLYSDTRNSFTHSIYVSYQQNLTDTLRFTAMGGAQINDPYNDVTPNTSTVTPYVDMSGTYTYARASSLQFGFTHSLNSTYLPIFQSSAINTNSGSITENQESSTVYLNLNHQFTSRLVGLFGGRIQHSSFNGGPAGGGSGFGGSENYYSAVANLNYTITKHLSVEIGYNFDQVDAVQANASYQRNRYEVGLTGSY